MSKNRLPRALVCHFSGNGTISSVRDTVSRLPPYGLPLVSTGPSVSSV